MNVVQGLIVISVITRLVSNSMNQKGFSFIELMLTLAISGALAFAGLNSYSAFNDSKELAVETDQVVSYLERAKKSTSAGEKPCESYTGTYVVSVTSTGLTVSANGCTNFDQNYTFQGNVSVLSGDDSITFQPFDNGVDAPMCVILQHRQSTKCTEIDVTQAGVVSYDQSADCSCS